MGALTIEVAEEGVTETVADELGAEVGVEAVATGLTGAWASAVPKIKKHPIRAHTTRLMSEPMKVNI